jgi:hypothetical protein
VFGLDVLAHALLRREKFAANRTRGALGVEVEGAVLLQVVVPCKRGLARLTLERFLACCGKIRSVSMFEL